MHFTPEGWIQPASIKTEHFPFRKRPWPPTATRYTSAMPLIEMNRTRISHLIEKTRDQHLFFALNEDVVRF